MSRSPQYNNDQYYHAKWKSIVNVMKNSNLGISRIAQAGSRARRQQRLDSDMDVIFAVARDPSRENFYPKLIQHLQNNFPYENIYPGSSYHVVHIEFKSGGKFDLVLLSETDFDYEFSQNLEYRKTNL